MVTIPIFEQDQLPDQLSELISQAIDDFFSLDQFVYYPSWCDWHEFVELMVEGEDTRDRCVVGLAGAVIANTLGIDQNASVTPRDFLPMDNIVNKLCALDAAQKGHWESALQFLGVDVQPSDREAIKAIPAPDNPYFADWWRFDIYVSSLVDRSRQLAALGF